MSRENVEAVRAVYEEWAKGNLRVGAELYDPRILMIPGADLTDANHYVGPEAIAEYTRALLSAWKDFTMAGEQFVGVGDSVLLAVRQRGVGRESGTPAGMDYYSVWTFRGPKVIRMEQFGERADALAALGLSEWPVSSENV